MILLRFLFQSSRARIVVGMVAGLMGGLTSAAALSSIQPAIEGGGSARPILLFAVASLASVALNILAEHLASVQAQAVLLDLRLKLARQILATPLVRLEQLGLARLLSALTEDASTVANALPGLAQLCPQFAIVIGCFAYMFWLAPWGAAVVAGLMVVGVLAYALPQRVAMQALERGRADADAMMHHFRALAEGVKQLQIHSGRADHFFEQRLAPTARSSQGHAVRAFRMYLLGTNLGRAFFLLAILTVICLGPLLLAPPTVIVGFALSILYLTRPMEVVLSWLPPINRGQVALAHIHSLGMALDPPRHARTRGPEQQARRIDLVQSRYVHHGQGDDLFTVGPVDLSLLAGELAFLIGGNGSGKTTLAKMLVGLYPLHSGQVRVNGGAVEDLESYRANFSVVFADSFPFDDLGIACDSDTVAAVVAEYGLPGFEIPLAGRDPTTLSQGQRKRLLLLAALIEDRPVYVFDEWAAEQDPLFRNVFYLQILPALRARGKIVLVITHDEQYFHVADRLLRFDYGRLVSSGERRLARSSVAVGPVP